MAESTKKKAKGKGLKQKASTEDLSDPVGSTLTDVVLRLAKIFNLASYPHPTSSNLIGHHP
ncbi:hypothetical protein C0J52_13934 [Blattella germanica]|nr:hypothetical protein C0J52_13934 [Blattella germanica]